MKRIVLILLIVMAVFTVCGCTDNTAAQFAAEKQSELLEKLKVSIDARFEALLEDMEEVSTNQVDIIFDDIIVMETDESGKVSSERVNELMVQYRVQMLQLRNDIKTIRKEIRKNDVAYAQVYQISLLLSEYLSSKKIRFKDIKGVIDKAKNMFEGGE